MQTARRSGPCVSLFLTLLTMSGATSPAGGAPIHNVVDNVGVFDGISFTEIDPYPGVNNAGQIIFTGVTSEGVGGVFLADTGAPGSPVSLLVDDSGVYDDFTGGASFINDSGVAAVRATRDDGRQEVFLVTSTGVVTPLVDTSGDLESLASPPTIAAGGSAVFHASVGGEPAVVAANGATPFNNYTIVEAAGASYDGFFLPIVNDTGDTLYFASNLATGGELILEAPDGSHTTIAATDAIAGPLTGALPFDLNDYGDIAYVAQELATGERSIRLYSAEDGSTTTLASVVDGYTFATVPEVGLNDGRLALFSDGDALHFADASGPHPLLLPGDPLFGGTLRLALAGKALNDNGQAAVLYALEDDTFGIALVTIPEPCAALLSLAAVFAAGMRRRR